MKKNLITLFLCTLAFGAGIGVNNTAMSNINSSKIAYVDVNKLASASQTINHATQVRDNQTKEMLKWYDSANSEIEKQETKEAKQTLIKKYEAQLIQKKKSIKEEYNKNIQKADSQMESVISQKAKEMGYSIVFKKDALLYGADDITPNVLPLIK